MTIYRLENLQEHLKNLSTLEEQESLIDKFKSKEAEFLRSKRVRLTFDDFKTIRVIGRGAFGIVRICQFHLIAFIFGRLRWWRRLIMAGSMR